MSQRGHGHTVTEARADDPRARKLKRRGRGVRRTDVATTRVLLLRMEIPVMVHGRQREDPLCVCV